MKVLAITLAVLSVLLSAQGADAFSRSLPTAVCPSGGGYHTVYPPHTAAGSTYMQTWGELFCDRVGLLHGIRLYYYYAHDHVWRLAASKTHRTAGVYDALVVNQCATPSERYHAWQAKGYTEGGAAVWSNVKTVKMAIAADGSC